MNFKGKKMLLGEGRGLGTGTEDGYLETTCCGQEKAVEKLSVHELSLTSINVLRG